MHHGFCTYYGRLEELGLGQGLWDLHTQYPRYKVVLTGWSLGAAAAVRHHESIAHDRKGGDGEIEV